MLLLFDEKSYRAKEQMSSFDIDPLALCLSLLRCQSVTPDDGGSLDIIAENLNQEFKIQWLNYQDTKNLLCTHGTGSPHLMFLGHVDVVPAGNQNEWSSPPFEPTERDGKIYARGACDMKSGVAAMTVAVKNFVSQYPNHSGTVSLLLTSDEEGSNINGIPKVVEWIKNNNIKIDYCITGEPSSRESFADAIKIGRRGSLNARLTVNGIQGHVAYPDLAKNPIHLFAETLNKLCQHKWDDGDEYFPPTSLQFSNIKSGVGSSNVIPGTLEVMFNFRFSPKHTADSLKQTVEQYLKQAGFDYQIEWSLSGNPFLTKSGVLVKTVSEEIKTLTGKEPKLQTDGGTSDARFIAPLGAEVIELGLRGESLHKIDEFFRIEELEPLTGLYQKIANRLLNA